MEKIFDIIIVDTLRFLMKLVFTIIAPGFQYTRYFIYFLLKNYKEIDEDSIVNDGSTNYSIIHYFKLLTFAWVLQSIVFYLYYLGYCKMIGSQLSVYSVIAAGFNAFMSIVVITLFNNKETYTIVK